MYGMKILSSSKGIYFVETRNMEYNSSGLPVASEKCVWIQGGHVLQVEKVYNSTFFAWTSIIPVISDSLSFH